MERFGFIRAAVASPRLQVANPEYNAVEHLRLIEMAAEKKAAIVVFPELSLTGYTCGDLFGQRLLLDTALRSLEMLLAKTAGLPVLSLVGLPLAVEDRLYNCAAVLFEGRVLGLVPKMHLPNYREYYEKRWFFPGSLYSPEEAILFGQKIPFGQLLFKSRNPGYTLGVEISEDLWMPIPPSSQLALGGANVIANLAASSEQVAKAASRRKLIEQQSARCVCAYLYAAAGVYESTTDMVFGGDCLIGENGQILASAERFSLKSHITYGDIDMEILQHDRQVHNSFADNGTKEKIRDIEFSYPAGFFTPGSILMREVSRNPFIPRDQATLEQRCEEIFRIQVAGLAKRMEHTGSKHAIIGVSGGLDSTLALLVSASTVRLLGLPPHRVLAVTMPGFGTSVETYSNALSLMQALEATVREIDIRQACAQHLQDIGHDPDRHDVTFENAQARERMQVLMDLANQEGGLVVGTGDLSELALGWSTYNGDHMSMYAVNSGIPKTLIRHLVCWAAENIFKHQAGEILARIVETPISPELLPLDGKGKITQKTEEVIGPYELHDFFLYYTLRHGMPPAKIAFLAEKSYEHIYTRAEIRKWLRVFYQRFFNSQFKRSCLPDGPKVGSVSLSPRSDWRMPSDAVVSQWLKEMEE